MEGLGSQTEALTVVGASNPLPQVMLSQELGTEQDTDRLHGGEPFHRCLNTVRRSSTSVAF